MKLHIRNKEFEEAGKEIISLFENGQTFSETEISAGWEDVQKRASLAKRRKLFRNIGYSAAAILCGIAFISYFTYQALSPVENEFSALFDIDSIQDIKEVTLLTNSQNVVLEDECKVEYNEEGNIIINEKVISGEEKEKTSLNQIIVPNGKRSYLVFKDGTKLSINSGSYVSYPATFAEDKREIYVQGEVYLEVAPDPDRPFYVKTEKFDIKVLGTSFNVSAYKEDSESSVVLVEGFIEMGSKKNMNVKLSPGHKMTVADDKFLITEVDVNEYILWKDNILYLGNYKNCSEIFNRLARRYDATFEYDKNIRDVPISGKLDLCERVEDVLDILSISAQFTYTQNNGVFFIESK